MPWWIVRRLITYFITLFIAVTAIFFMFRLLPGDPIRTFFMDLERQSQFAHPGLGGAVEKYRIEFGLDKDLYTQYVLFLKNLILNGDLGPTISGYPKHAQEFVLSALPWTLGLLFTSALISWGLGVILGLLSGWARGSKVDTLLSSMSLVLSQIPVYYLAIILVLVFGFAFSLLPTTGAYSPSIRPSLTLEFFVDVIRHAALPALSLVIVTASGLILSSRSLIVSILGEDYLVLAKAKGLRKGWILYKYVLRNALLPQVTGLGIMLGFTVNGSILIENIFNYQGIGRLFGRALGVMDYNLITGILLISTFAVLTANLLIELICPLIDPRVSYGGK